MTVINIPAFSGLNILAAPQRIREDEATVAVGCDFRSLDLRAFRGDADTGMGVTDTSGITSQGASIFQWDDTHWVGVLGDKNFARSPTFNSDATTGQRVFVADNAAPLGNGWDWVQDVEQTDLESAGRTHSYFLRTNVEGISRLGVPKPAAINQDDIDRKERDGRVTELVRFTNANAQIEIDSATALKPGDKINLNVPGIGDGPFTILKKSTATPPAFTLSSSKLEYIEVQLLKTTASTEIKFEKDGHGLSDGAQVILNRRGDSNTALTSKLPSTYNQTVFTVERLDEKTFKLRYGEASTELALTALVANETKSVMKYALVATEDDGLPTPWNPLYVTVNTLANYQQQVNFLNIPTEVTSTWQVALETLTERAYVVTFVNKYGDESEPSDPTKPILVADGDEVTFKKFPIAPATYTGELAGVALGDYSISRRDPADPTNSAKAYYKAKLRIYRTDATGTFRLITTEVDADRTIDWSEIWNSNGTAKEINWVDKYPDSELGEPLSTQGWQIPPKDVNGILISPGGSLVGYKGRVVVGSVPYAPYAFPISNRVAFDYPVKGLVATSAGIVVVTEGHPALIVGDDPATWSIQKLEYPYGCVSRRSIVDMGEMAIYASADGLVGVAGATVEILTRDALKREQWQDLYNPKRIIAAHAEGRYYGITYLEDTNGNVISRKAFMFDPRTRSFVDLTVGTPYPIALYSRLTDDTLLILKSDGKVYGWNRDTGYWVPYTWWSKWFQLTKPDIFGCAQILSPALLANHQVTMTLFGWDGESVVQVCQYTTIDGLVNPAGKVYKFDKNVNPFRLPVPANRYTVYTVKLEGTLPIGQVTIASTMDEIKQL